MKLEKLKVSYPHEMDSKGGSSKPLGRTQSATPNTSLPEAAAIGDKNRLGISYTVGKNPNVKMASHAQIEGLRPAKSEMKNG